MFQIISNLDRKKFNPVVCCLYDFGSLGMKLVNENEGIEVYYNLMQSKWDVSGVWKLLRIMKKNNTDILFMINSPLTVVWGILCAKLTGVGACITRMTIAKPTPISHATRWRIINKTVLASPLIDMIIAQADSHKKILIEDEGIKPQKMEVVYNGVDIERFQQPVDKATLRAKIGLNPYFSVVGIVARLSIEKGHTVFLQAARKILTAYPDVYFLIVGDGKQRGELEEMTRDLGIESNVFFLGAIIDIHQVISLFDVAVMPSDFEAVSNAILEYMAASKPVVATGVGSTPEIVVDRETGYLIPCGDADALAEAVLRLLKDKGLAENMGRAGRKKVEEKFTLRKMIERYESIFTSLSR